MINSVCRSAPSPFDRQDADLLLHSSDKVEYRVHRQILTVASPIFESMLTLPQPITVASEGGPGVVDVTEDSLTLETLLRVCYPVVDPVISTIDLARTVLEAAMKYDMQVGIPFAKRALQGFIKTQPLRTYAMACRYELEEIAKLAAIEAVEQHVVDGVYVAELEELPAGCYYRLLTYQRTRIPTTPLFFPPFLKSNSGPQNSPALNLTFCSPTSGSTENGSSESQITSTTRAISNLPTPFDDPNADVVIISSDEVRFRVYRHIISLASPVLKEMLEAARAAHSHTSSETEDASSVLHVPEHSSTLLLLLQLCYPSGTPKIGSIRMHILMPVLGAAEEYKIERVKWIILQRWSELAKSDPLSAYVLAASYSWKEQAVSVAKLLLLWDYEQLQVTYVPEMEVTSTGPYFRLLQYYKSCGEAAVKLTSGELTWASDHLKDAVSCSRCSPFRTSVSSVGGVKDNDEYLSTAAELLRQRPSGTVLTTEPVLAAILKRVGPRCRQHLKQILSFNEALSRAVDDEVAKIDPEMLFQSCTS